MQNHHIVVLCAIVFCAALLLGSILNRPTIILKEHDDRSGGGWVFFLLGICFIYFFFGTPSGCNTSEELPNHPEKNEPPPEQQVREPINSDERNYHPIINQPPQHRNNLNTMVNSGSNENTYPNSYGREKEEIPKARLQLVIVIKRYTDCERAKNLPNHFTQWGMKIFEISGECWVCVEVPDREDATNKIHEWNLNKKDFKDMNLEFSIKTISVPD